MQKFTCALPCCSVYISSELAQTGMDMKICGSARTAAHVEGRKSSHATKKNFAHPVLFEMKRKEKKKETLRCLGVL